MLSQLKASLRLVFPCVKVGFSFLQFVIAYGLTLSLLLVSVSPLSLAESFHDQPLPIQSGSKSGQVLTFGEVIEKSISGGEVQTYQITLKAGQYLRLAVEQLGVEVVTRLQDANNNLLIEVDSAGKETLSAIAPEKPEKSEGVEGQSTPVVYCVAVRARQHGIPGRYLIRIEEQRAAMPQDQIRISAERLTAEGALLSRHSDKEALDQADMKYLAALQFWRTLQDRREEARTLYLIALLKQAASEHQAALEHYLQALEISRADGDLERENLVLGALGTLYFALGDKAKAIDCYNQSLAYAQAQAIPTQEASALVNLGVVYKSLGNHVKALEFYQKALPLAREIGDKVTEAAVLTNMARLYTLTGDTQNSFAINQQALSVWRMLGDANGELTTLKNMGVLAEAEGRLPESQEYLNRALALSQTLGDAMREAHIRGDLARITRAAGSFDDSRSQIEQALTIIESMRGQLLNPDLRASFTAANRRYYEFYLDLLMRQPQLQSSNDDTNRGAPDYAAEALRISERAHARALADLIAEGRINIRQDVNAELLARERSLEQRLMTKKTERTALVRKKAPAADIELLNREILTLGLEQERVITEVKRASPQYASLVYPEPLGLAEIQHQLLDPDTLLLEYTLGEECSYLWVVSHSDLRSFTLPGRAVIESQARRYYERLNARGETVKFEKPKQAQARIEQADSELDGAALALSQSLLSTAAGLFGHKRLLIVGDGMLNYIPFGTLPEPAPEGQRDKDAGNKSPRVARYAVIPEPLIANHEIVNLPSASVLAEMRHNIPNRRQATSDLAIIADPVFSQNDVRLTHGQDGSISSAQAALNQSSSFLPVNNTITESLAVSLRAGSERDAQGLPRLQASRQEADRIAQFASGRDNLVALDFRAKRDLVTSGALAQYRYLHFATHGLLNSQTPELSGLVFSLLDEKGQAQKGVLRLSDIYNLKLSADLVVLSACRTGLGQDIKGEGAIGLPRGFMYAGVSRVISSLWSVDDSATAELMTRFYREMLVGQKTPSAALRAAQLSMRKEAKWQKPYYWAGFVLQGEPK